MDAGMKRYDYKTAPLMSATRKEEEKIAISIVASIKLQNRMVVRNRKGYNEEVDRVYRQMSKENKINMK